MVVIFSTVVLAEEINKDVDVKIHKIVNVEYFLGHGAIECEVIVEVIVKDNKWLTKEKYGYALEDTLYIRGIGRSSYKDQSFDPLKLDEKDEKEAYQNAERDAFVNIINLWSEEIRMMYTTKFDSTWTK